MDIRWIGEPETGLTGREVGGKSLNSIKTARLLDGREINGMTVEVPAGFALGGELQERFMEDHQNYDRITPEDAELWEIPEEERERLRTAYERLEDPVSARSSGIGEDSDGDNFAGRYESEIGLEGFDELLEGIKTVLGSQFDARVKEYQDEIGYGKKSDLRILVQEAKDADISAVMDSRADMNGRVGFNINEGLPMSIVDGESVDQAFADITQGDFDYDPEEDYFSNPNRDVKTTIEGDEVPTEEDGELLNEEEIEALVEISRELEDVSGQPGNRRARDMEVGINRSENKIYIYQDRPVPGSDATNAEDLPEIDESRVIARTDIVSGGPELTNYDGIPAIVLDDSTPNPDTQDDAYSLNDFELEDLDEELGDYVLVTQSYNEILHSEIDPKVVLATDAGFGGHLINILGNENVDTDYMSFLGQNLDQINTYDEIGVAFNGLEGVVYEVE